MTNAPTSESPLFDFEDLGDLFAEPVTVTGTINFTVNGGTPELVHTFNSGFADGSVASPDGYLSGALPGVAVGDIVVLSAGTLTTTRYFDDAPPR